MVDLQRALQAVSAIATAPAVTRIPLHNSLATDAENAVAEENKLSAVVLQENERSLVSVDNARYLEQVRRYGVLLRLMGDQLESDYGNGFYCMQPPIEDLRISDSEEH